MELYQIGWKLDSLDTRFSNLAIRSHETAKETDQKIEELRELLLGVTYRLNQMAPEKNEQERYCFHETI